MSTHPRTDAARKEYNEIDSGDPNAGRGLVLDIRMEEVETELTTALARVAELEKEVAYQKDREEADRLVIRDLSSRLDSFDNELSQVDPICDSLTRQLSESQLRISEQAKYISELREECFAVNQKFSESQAQLADMTRKFQSEQRSIQHIVKVFKEEKAELSAQLTSAREDSARLDWLEKSISIYEEDGSIEFSICIGKFEASIQKEIPLRSAIDSARGHLAETPAGGETGKDAWQPIETAPKDGTRLMGWDKHGWIPKVTWDELREWIEIGQDGRIKRYHCEITHWQPLPPPPQGKEQE